MSFFKSVLKSTKKFAMTAKCKTGWHAGHYKSIEGKPKCQLAKTCPDCDEYITKINHKYNNWDYVKAFNCTQVRACVHCDREDQRIHHNHLVTGTNDHCDELLECSRCDNKKKGSKRHQWDSWSREGDRMVRGCQKCGAGETKVIKTD